MSKTDELIARIERLEEVIANIGLPARNTPTGFITDAEVARRLNVTTRTLVRWDETPELNFPPVIVVRKRRYRKIADLDAWEKAQAENLKQQARRTPPRKRIKATSDSVTA